MSLIPSESENFPESFRVKVGWHIDQQPEDADAIAALQRLVAALPPAPPPMAPPTSPENRDVLVVTNPGIPSAPPVDSIPMERITSVPTTLPASETPAIAPESPPEPLQPTVPEPEQIADQSAPEDQVPPVPIVPTDIETPAPEPPEPTGLDSAVMPEPDQSQTDIPLSNTADNTNPSESSPGSSDMTTLVTHFLSTGVPISISQPNGEMTSPAPPSTPQRSGFVISTNELPAIEAPPSSGAPNAPKPPAQNSGGSTPTAKTIAPITASENNPIPETVGEPPPNGAVPPAGGSVSIQTSAQAQQIMQLIAAGQRGDLAPASIADPAARPTPEVAPTAGAISEVAPQSVGVISATPQYVEPVKNSESARAFAAPETLAATEKRTPVKIRITPRRIKPRPQVDEATQAEILPEAINHSPNNGATAEIESPRPVALAKPAPAPAQAEPPKPKPKPILTRAPFEHQEPIIRKAATPRRDVAHPDLLLFSARERRNRWIGFGLSEIAAVLSLILLGHYGFTHHFPDPTLKLLVFILLFTTAAIAVALPIAFLRNDPARWGKQN